MPRNRWPACPGTGGRHQPEYAYKRGVPRVENLPESVSISRIVDNLGFVTSETDGELDTTGYGYDDLGNMSAVTTPRTNDDNISIDYDFNSTGIIRTLTRGTYTEVRSYDGFGNLERVDVTGAENLFVRYQYDEDGRRTRIYLPNSNTQWETLSYDELGRIDSVTHADLSSVLYNYLSNNRVRTTDERGYTTTSYYQSFGDPSAKELIRIDAPESLTTILERNKIGQLLSVTRGSVSRIYTYDTRFFLDTEIHPEIGVIDYGRDLLGNMETRSVGGSATTTFVLDDLYRIDAINYAASSTPDIDYEYYDDGLIQTAVKGNSRWDYLYDANKNLTEEKLTIDGRVYPVGYSFNSRDAVSTQTYPSSTVVNTPRMPMAARHRRRHMSRVSTFIPMASSRRSSMPMASRRLSAKTTGCSRPLSRPAASARRSWISSTSTMRQVTSKISSTICPQATMWPCLTTG